MYKCFFKRFLDIVLSLMALVILSPLFLVLIILGRILMKGNPFFTQERPGKNEKIFKLIKFRSMTEEKDKDGNYLPDEVRLTSYGKFLRKTSIDELPEFNRNTLEVLRGPLEDRNVTISRLYSKVIYPSNFMLIASMNPCPCGYYGSTEKECQCSKMAIEKYLNRISGPLLDRIDLHVEVKPVKYQKLDSENKVESSKQIKERVNKARRIQFLRYKDAMINILEEDNVYGVKKRGKSTAWCV